MVTIGIQNKKVKKLSWISFQNFLKYNSKKAKKALHFFAGCGILIGNSDAHRNRAPPDLIQEEKQK